MLFVGASGNDPKNDLEAFLKDYAWILCVVVAVIIVLTIIVVFAIKNKNKAGSKKEESKAPISEWVDALGGKDNILEVSSARSRLSVKLKQQDLVNRESLTKLGVSSIVKMSDKLTLVTNLDNQKIEENIKNCLQN